MGMKWGQGVEPERVYQKHLPVPELFLLSERAVRPRQGTHEQQQPVKGTREKGKQESGNSGDCLLWKPLKIQNYKLLLAVSFIQM